MNKFGDHFPDIAKQWHPSKNGTLTPYDVAVNSHKKVWWTCQKGHTWKAVISSRSRGTGCPYCSGRFVLKEKSLGVLRPELSKEWHPAKNGQKTPFDVAAQSHKIVWWKCTYCKNDWEAMISNRYKGRGCPHCNSGSQTSFPEQALFYYLSKVFNTQNRYNHSFQGKDYEIDIFIPSIKLGIEYDGHHHQSKIKIKKDEEKNKILRDSNIKLIRVRLSVNPKINPYESIVFIHEDGDENFISLKDVLKNIVQYILSNYSLQKIETSNLTKLLIVDILKDKNAIISTYKSNEKNHSIRFSHPHLVKEWHPIKNGALTPEMFKRGSKTMIHWICDKNHEWEASIDNRANKNSGCPVCAREKYNAVAIQNLINKKGSLFSEFPHLVQEIHPTKNVDFNPKLVTPGSHKKVWWKCIEGHEWETAIEVRTKRGYGCPVCNRNKSAKNRILNSIKKNGTLFENYPELARQWNYKKNTEVSPNEITPGSHKKVWWRCDNGHEWKTQVRLRTKRRSGCPYCLKK